VIIFAVLNASGDFSLMKEDTFAIPLHPPSSPLDPFTLRRPETSLFVWSQRDNARTTIPSPPTSTMEDALRAPRTLFGEEPYRAKCRTTFATNGQRRSSAFFNAK